jgi:uncharacterized protein (DUF1778 family)
MSASEKRRLTELVAFRVDKRQADLIRAAAVVCGLSPGAFVREAALGRAAACPVFSDGRVES